MRRVAAHSLDSCPRSLTHSHLLHLHRRLVLCVHAPAGRVLHQLDQHLRGCQWVGGGAGLCHCMCRALHQCAGAHASRDKHRYASCLPLLFRLAATASDACCHDCCRRPPSLVLCHPAGALHCHRGRPVAHELVSCRACSEANSGYTPCLNNPLPLLLSGTRRASLLGTRFATLPA